MPTDVELERKRRINLAVWAYAYEFMDKFFREQFTPYSGSWIHAHPQLERIKELYELFYKENSIDKNT